MSLKLPSNSQCEHFSILTISFNMVGYSGVIINFIYKNNRINRMTQYKAPLFGVEIKTGGKVINVPVYQGDSDLSLLDRLYSNYPQPYNPQCREVIKNKVIESLQKILKFEKISNTLRHNIIQFLKKCEIDVKITFREGNEDKNTNKNNSDKSKQKKRKIKDKQNLGYSKNGKQFTKLYQITKNIFNVQDNPLSESKQNLSKLYQNRSKSKKKLPKNKLAQTKSWTKFFKENQSQILKRIENKIKKYQKHCQNHSFSQLKNDEQSIILTQSNLAHIKNPLQSDILNSVITESNENKQKNTRFKYNYEEIISQRKINQSCKKSKFPSRRENKNHDGVQFSRSYESENVLKFNYRQQNVDPLLPKYSYSINLTSINDDKINGRRNSISYDRILFPQNKNYKNIQSTSNHRNPSTIMSQQNTRSLNPIFSQQKLKKFKYL